MLDLMSTHGTMTSHDYNKSSSRSRIPYQWSENMLLNTAVSDKQSRHAYTYFRGKRPKLYYTAQCFLHIWTVNSLDSYNDYPYWFQVCKGAQHMCQPALNGTGSSWKSQKVWRIIKSAVTAYRELVTSWLLMVSWLHMEAWLRAAMMLT